ncbi:Lsr2 dimerization domain-containing protein [Glutamicibacter arilaitensis]|uniref:Lsr2 dimerization domain-containing protein n=1 Tax=Glutamicibacter arilaitensis TaxID=256701 RepID=UPI003FD5041D
MAMIRVSDISGDREAQELTFSVGESHYEIDLTDAEVEKMKGDLGMFLDVARKPAQKVSTASFDAKEVRVWAQKHGIEVHPQGRIPKVVLEQWKNR